MLERLKRRSSLALSLVFFVFCILIVTLLIFGALGAAAYRLGLIPDGSIMDHEGPGLWRFILPAVFLFLISALIGAAVTALLSRVMLRPMRRLIAATREVAGGNFEVRVDLGGIAEMEDLASSFNKMAKELSNTETLRRDFVNDFSHEFKTPIVSIRGFAKLLQQADATPGERREWAGIIAEESERLVTLSTNILNLSKWENMEILAEREGFSLDEQMRRAIALMEPKWSAKSINMDVELGEAWLCANADMIHQVWTNLLDNAIKFTPRNGNIKVTLREEGEQALAEIADDGQGIDPAQLPYVFDRFYQGDSSRKSAGNGLGLSICKRIVELNGGKIEAAAGPGGGMVFRVWLPTAQSNTES